MLFAHHVDDEDDEFVLVLPPGSVRSYFRREGRGMALVVEPGPLAFPDADRDCKDVRAAVLTEAGRVLGVAPAEVLSQPFARLKTIAQSQGFQRTPWDSRKRSRSRSPALSR